MSESLNCLLINMIKEATRGKKLNHINIRNDVKKSPKQILVRFFNIDVSRTDVIILFSVCIL